MAKRRGMRAGLAVLGALIAFSPALPAGDLALAAAAPLSAFGSGSSDAEDLAAYRNALLSKQTVAIEVTNANIKALYEQRVQELGYEPSVTDPREIARQIMANKYSWDERQFSCYDSIIMRESRWIVTADNPHSSAYGIPQALPGKRMAAFGADWRTNPVTQIRWGLDYVSDRYGTPCSAWSFKRSHGWY
ncbi:MAG: lytic transglycosylase domain-containing protein [Propionibacteriaceae bacterium]|nr:lytic transglycosylase domain-containing protein [Propionibacteriaceae bacterium]